MTFHDPKLNEAVAKLTKQVSESHRYMDAVVKPDIAKAEKVLLASGFHRTVWLDLGQNFAIGWAEISFGKWRICFSRYPNHINPRPIQEAKLTERIAAHPHLARLVNEITHRMKK